jgi:hypothetical protein
MKILSQKNIICNETKNVYCGLYQTKNELTIQIVICIILEFEQIISPLLN